MNCSGCWTPACPPIMPRWGGEYIHIQPELGSIHGVEERLVSNCYKVELEMGFKFTFQVYNLCLFFNLVPPIRRGHAGHGAVGGCAGRSDGGGGDVDTSRRGARRRGSLHGKGDWCKLEIDLLTHELERGMVSNS